MHCGEEEVNKIKVFYTRINVAYKSFACTLSDQCNDHVKQKRQRFYLSVIHLVLHSQHVCSESLLGGELCTVCWGYGGGQNGHGTQSSEEQAYTKPSLS